MEIYGFYNFISVAFLVFTQLGNVESRIAGIIVGGVIWLALFVLQGIGLYKMAKNRGLKRKWLAFVPFANIYYIGELAGEIDLFGHKIKRLGLYAMISQILATVACASALIAELYLFINCGNPIGETPMGTPYWTELSGTALSMSRFYDLSFYIIPLAQQIFSILMLVLLMGLYKKYYPKNYIFLGLLMLFPVTRFVSRYIVIFILRNREAIDYAAYMRAKREAYMRQQQRYQNTYGNPYNHGPYNPYGYPYQNPYNQPQNKPEEPFSEFSKDKKPDEPKSEEPVSTGENDCDSDDFFN